MGNSMIAKRVYNRCPVMHPNRVILIDLVGLDMFGLDIILGMDFLHACFASLDCRTTVVKFYF